MMLKAGQMQAGDLGVHIGLKVGCCRGSSVLEFSRVSRGAMRLVELVPIEPSI
jgi:hypothetical protein